MLVKLIWTGPQSPGTNPEVVHFSCSCACCCPQKGKAREILCHGSCIERAFFLISFLSVTLLTLQIVLKFEMFSHLYLFIYLGESISHLIFVKKVSTPNLFFLRMYIKFFYFQLFSHWWFRVKLFFFFLLLLSLKHLWFWVLSQTVYMKHLLDSLSQSVDLWSEKDS